MLLPPPGPGTCYSHQGDSNLPPGWLQCSPAPPWEAPFLTAPHEPHWAKVPGSWLSSTLTLLCGTQHNKQGTLSGGCLPTRLQTSKGKAQPVLHNTASPAWPTPGTKSALNKHL